MTTEVSGNTHRKMPPKGNVEGVIHIAQPGQLAQEFITASKNFHEALARCYIRDEQLKNDVIVYEAQLELFEMTEEIEQLTCYLDAGAAVGGFNRSLAGMVGVGIYVAEGAGIKLSKENHKALMEIQRERARSGKPEEEQKQG